MLWLNPKHALLDGTPLTHVESIALDLSPNRLATEHDDFGPHIVFADVPEVRAVLRVRRHLNGSDALALRPGDQSLLSFRIAPNASDAPGTTISATVVITSIRHDLSLKSGAIELIDVLAIATTGNIDPITITPDQGAPA